MRDQPSWTAQSVATEILMIAGDRRFQYLVSDDVKEATAMIFKMIPGLRGKLAVLSEQPGFQRILGIMEGLMTPNKALYLALRKRWMEDQVRDNLRNDINQVVILGAGYDTLSYRLHREFPNVLWFEVDHPATQKVKKAALLKQGKVEQNLQFVSCNLATDPWLEALTGHNLFDIRGETLSVAEGLFAYLDRETTIKVLKALQTFGETEGRLLGTMNAKVGSSNPLVELKLRLIGEPYQWGLSPEKLPGLLREQTWDVLEVKHGQALALQYLQENKVIRIPEDEYLFSAVKRG